MTVLLSDFKEIETLFISLFFLTETNEEGMPGLPVEIEPESETVTELVTEKLNEISPVTEDTIPDLDIEETTKTGILDDLENFEDIEDDKEEPLNEVEPPDEDEIQDGEPPDQIVNEIMGDQEIESDQESENEEDGDETDSPLHGTDVDQVEGESNREADTDTLKTVTDGTDSETEQGRTEVAGEEEQAESDNQNSNDADIKRDSSEEFQDAADKLDSKTSESKDHKELEKEQINEDNKHSSDKTGDKDRNIHDDHEGTPVDPVETNLENTDEDKCVNNTEGQSQVTDIDHNANIESQSVENESVDDSKTAGEDLGRQEVDLKSDVTVTDLRTSTADTVW